MTTTFPLAAPTATKIMFSAPDISCGGCASAIRRSLGATEGVNEIAVDVANKTVTVTGQAASRPETILRVLDRAGFPATQMETAADTK